MTDIDNDELEVLVGSGVVIYDVRRPDEWRHTGVIQGSRRLTFVDRHGALLPDFLPRFTAAVPRDQPVILICHIGGRTSALGKHLAENLGYTRIYNLRGGISSWIAAGRPVVLD